jgi:CRISPR-associated protein Cas1
MQWPCNLLGRINARFYEKWGWSMQVVINTPGTFLTQKDECFRLKQQEKVFDISPLKVESIVISNQAMISSQAVVLALEHNIDIVFLDKYGDPVGRVWFSKMGSTALIRRRQLEAVESPLGVQLVTEMVGQKTKNQVHFLKKLMHARPGQEEQFESFIQVIEDTRNSITFDGADLEGLRNRIMGLEGTAGRAYFRCLSALLPEKYRFKERSRRPARDPFNACLNYCYGILYSLVEKACVLSGLDPYVGFLHTDNYNKKSLVFDLIEPFRVLGEQTAVYLFTEKQIKDEYFDMQDESVSLNQKGKPVVVEAMNRHLDDSVRYRRKNVKRRHIIQHECHRLANILLAESGEKRPDWLEIKEF